MTIVFWNRQRKFWLFLLTLVIALSQTMFAQPFTHPGCLSTQADLDRMQAKVQAGAHPWIDSWNILIANSHAQTTWNPNPQPVVYRGNDGVHAENYSILANDCAAAYQCALRYHGSGDTTYANKA